MKQRLIGAAILVALAVIFLPMLIKGPAPTSGVSDIPLELPDAPSQGQFETRELPLVTPATPTQGGALGMPEATADRLPTVDTTANPGSVEGDDAMLSAATAGGDYAVSFGSYQSSADADRVIVALREVRLPGYQESYRAGSRTLHRVRIGPYADQAAAEAARVRAARIRDDVGSKVVVLDADAATPASAANAVAGVSTPAAATGPAVSKPIPLPETKPAAAALRPATEVAQSAPKPPESKPAAPAAPTQPVSGVGYAVQLGAFSQDEQAIVLRDRARVAGFNAFVEQVRTDKGMLNRVRVGPVADRAAADQLKAQVSAKLGINGFVQSHP